MAKVMAFTDPTGTDHPGCYWRIVQLNMSVADRSVSVQLYGYHTKAARKTGKRPIDGAIKTYSVTGDAFDALMAAHLAPGGKNIMKMAYEDVVNVTKDAPAPTAEDPNAKKGFFDGAADDVDS